MALDFDSALAGHAPGVYRARRAALAASAALAFFGLERLSRTAVQAWTLLSSGSRPSGCLDFECMRSDFDGPLHEFYAADWLWSPLLHLAAAVLFLWWFALVVRLTNALSPRPLPWGAGSAVVFFFIPLLNMIVPYAIASRAYAALAPDAVPEPPFLGVADSSTGYRQIRWTTEPRGPLPRASVLAWWCTFWLGDLVRWLGRAYELGGTCAMGIERTMTIDPAAFAMLGNAIDLASIGLAILMVRAITARLVERVRRILGNDDAALRSAGIALP